MQQVKRSMPSQGSYTWETSNLQARFSGWDNDTLIVFFAPMGSYVGSGPLWGEEIAEKLGASSLCFAHLRSPLWYPAGEVRCILDQALPLVKFHKQVITYGASMGAYAAIKYADALDALFAIAFSPQYSIAPSDVPAGLNRFIEFYREELHFDMRISGMDCSRPAYIFFDPRDATDLYHADLITRTCSDVVQIQTPFLSHEVVRAFAGTQRTRELLGLCLKRDLSGIQRFSNTIRRLSPLRSIGLALCTARKRPSISRALICRYDRYMNDANRAQVLRDMFVFYRDRSKFEAAEDAASLLIKVKPKDPESYLLLAGLRVRQGRLQDALEAALKAHDISPGNRKVLIQLAAVCMRSQDYERANIFISRGLAVYPGDPALIELFKQYNEHAAACAILKDN